MSRDEPVGQRGPLILLGVLIIGCPDEPFEGGAAETGTTLGSSSGSSTSTTGKATADETAGSDPTGGEGTIDCPVTKDPLPQGTFPEVSEPEDVSIEVSGLCDDIEGMGLMQMRRSTRAPRRERLGSSASTDGLPRHGPSGTTTSIATWRTWGTATAVTASCGRPTWLGNAPDELEDLQAVRLTFGLPGTAPSGRVLIDSLELTSSPFDAEHACP